MPPDLVRSSNTKGRQKSCSACAQAKRKCDLQQPNCLRCTRQRLVCTYPPGPPQPRRSRPVPTPPRPNEPSLINELFGDSSLDFSFDLDIPEVAIEPDTELREPSPDLSRLMYDVEQANGTLQTPGGAKPAHVTPIVERYPSYKEFSNLIASEIFESRVGYSMEQWKLAPRMMVERNCTPWSHPNLYEELMPRSMQGTHYRLKHSSLF